jgi:hypothetical protein
MNWLSDIHAHARKVYSQVGQDGITEYIFKNIGVTNKFCVEFGFDNTKLEGGEGAAGSNVARLVLEEKWNALLLDANNENPSINLHKETLTPENICDVFKKYGVPERLDYVSIDVDSIDLWLFRALLAGGFRPRLVSVEYNANFPPDVSVTVLPGTTWKNMDAAYGASLLALVKVAEEFEYYLVAAIKHFDLFFVRKDLLVGLQVPTLSIFEEFTGLPTHAKPTAKRSDCFVEYPSMEPISIDLKKRMGWET